MICEPRTSFHVQMEETATCARALIYGAGLHVGETRSRRFNSKHRDIYIYISVVNFTKELSLNDSLT